MIHVWSERARDLDGDVCLLTETSIDYALRQSVLQGKRAYAVEHAATEGIRAAVRNGVRSIEHGIYLDEETVELMVERGAWLVPTLHAPRAVVAAAEAGLPLPQAAVDKARQVTEAHLASVRLAHEAGVRIAMGTDCGVGPHGTNLEELGLMTEAGLSPLEALHATTGSAADLLGVGDDRGRLRPSARADLVVVDGDPEDVTGLRERVREVHLDGRLVHRGT